MTSDFVCLRPKSTKLPTFLNRTYDILQVILFTFIGSHQLLCCQVGPNGVGFIVIKEKQFSQEILPKYFKHSIYPSFVRHKIRDSGDESHFHHESFQRKNRLFKGNVGSFCARSKGSQRKRKGKVETLKIKNGPSKSK